MDKATLWTTTKNPIGVIQIIMDTMHDLTPCDALTRILNQNGYIVVRNTLPHTNERHEIAIAKYIKSKCALPLFAIGYGGGANVTKRILAHHNLYAAAAYTEHVPTFSWWNLFSVWPAQDLPVLILSDDIRSMSLYHQYAEHNLHNLNIVVYPETKIDVSNENARHDIVQFFNSVHVR